MIARARGNVNGDAIKLAIVAYYRNSGKVNEVSIERQRAEVRSYAAQRGWTILAEYIDTNKSGSKETEKRTAFARMVAAAGRGDFNAILVWDSSRFGRLDSIDVMEPVKVLRDSGVHLECVQEGRIDWNSSMGRMQWSMLSESNHEYSIKISANTISGREQRLAEGYWPHGNCPFGFDRQYIENGVVVATVPRAKRLAKARSWKLKLIPNMEEAEPIRFAFEQMDIRDTSVRWIIRELNGRNADSPNGPGKWDRSSMNYVLRNPVYIGICSVGRIKRNHESFGKVKQEQRENACEPIIDRALFDRVQLKIKSRKELQHKPHGGSRCSALSGILRCGHCGYTLLKKNTKRGVVFTCQSAFLRPTCGCHQWRIYEHEILPELCKLVTEQIDMELLRAMQPKPELEQAEKLDELKSEAARLRKQIKRGEENFLLADSSLVPALQKTLLEWKAELSRVENTAHLLETDGANRANKAIVAWWDKIKSGLVTVVPGNVVDAGVVVAKNGNAVRRHFGAGERPVVKPVRIEGDKLREVLNRLKTTVIVSWKPNGKRFWNLDRAIVRAEIDGGEILREAGLIHENYVGSNSTLAPHLVLVVEKEIVFNLPGPFARFQTLRDEKTGRLLGRIPLQRPA